MFAVSGFSRFAGIALAAFASSALAVTAPCSLDRRFSGDGITAVQLPVSTYLPAYVARDSLGRYVVATTFGNDATEVAVARFLANGTPDASFGVGGLAYTMLGFGGGRVFGVAIDQGDAIRVIRQLQTPFSNAGMMAVGFTSAGMLDADFGEQGFLPLDCNMPGRQVAQLGGIATDDSGRILVFGRLSGVGSPGLMARLSANGSLDPTFGTGGCREIATPSGILAVARDRDGFRISGSTATQYWIGRVTANGDVDTAHGALGFVARDLPPFAPAAGGSRALAVDAAGRATILGSYFSDGGYYDFFLAHHDASGNLATGWGSGGQVLHSSPFDGAQFDAIVAIADGSVVVAGGIGGEAAIFRFGPDGDPDEAECSFTTRAPLLFGNFSSVVVEADRLLAFATGTFGGQPVLAAVSILPRAMFVDGFE